MQMETEKLYYTDSRLSEFTAAVQACREVGKDWEIVLDRTAFYPEGGGQPCDRGTLNGCDVLDVREEDGVVFHRVEKAFAPGEEVAGRVDMERRMDYTRQHSADHILTGVIHRRYGYENVGFHMGQESTFIDLNGLLDEDALAEMERLANEVILVDLPVEISWPDGETLSQMDYRSKKELTGAVRIVTVPGVDVCACCGTHVRRTGEVGCIKILSCTHLRGGVRIEYVAGLRAYRYFDGLQKQNRLVSVALSAKPLQTAAAVQRLQEERDGLQMRLARLEREHCAAEALRLCGKGDVLLFEEGLSTDSVRRLADAVKDTCGGLALVCSGGDETGYQYALAVKEGDVRAFGKELNAGLNGRGGGRDANFLQGSLKAKRAEIAAFWESRKP